MKTDDNKSVLIAQKRKLLRVSSFLFIALCFVMAGFFCVSSSFGWRSLNVTVNESNMRYRGMGQPFELSVSHQLRSDAVRYYDPILDTFGYSTDNVAGLETSKNSAAIKMVMEDETGTGILAPGTYGTLTFTITPKVDADLTVHFSLSMDTYYAVFEYSRGKMVPSEYDSATLVSLNSLIAESDIATASMYTEAIRYLDGHILFYKHRDNELHYSDRIDPETGFDVEISGGLAREISVYWIWPNTIFQILFEDSTPDPAMFSESQAADSSGLSPRNELKSHISQYPDYYFSSTYFAGKTEQQILDMLELNDPDDIIPLSNGYNNADQIIGERIRLVLVSLMADVIH